MQGQEYYWFFSHAAPQYGGIITTSTWPIPSGDTVSVIGEILDELVSRHEVLRSTFPISGNGHPVQRIHEPYHVQIHLGAEGEDAQCLATHLMSRSMDVSVDWPVRVGLVMKKNEPHELVLVANHIAIDGHTIMLLQREYETLAGRGNSPVPLGTPTQPLERARAERISKRTDQYFRDFFDRMPSRMFHTYHPGARNGGSGFDAATLCMPGIFHSAERIAKRHRVTPAMVFATAYTIVVSALSGQRSCAFDSASINRHEEDTQNLVGCLFQPALSFVDVHPEATLKATLREVFRATLLGLRHGQYSYWRMRELMSRASSTRGVNLRLAVHYNYLQIDNIPEQEIAGRPDILPWGSYPLEWERSVDWEDYDTDLYFRVGGYGSKLDALFLLAHESVLNPPQLENSLRAIAGIIAEWADRAELEDQTISDIVKQFNVPVINPGDDWVYVDHSWINTSELADILMELPGVEFAEVQVTAPGVCGVEEIDHDVVGKLIAHVMSQQRDVTPGRLRQHVLAALPDNPAIITPHWFAVFDEQPSASEGLVNWGRVRLEGTGVGPDPEVSTSSTEQVLCAVFAHYHGFPVGSLADSYVLAGGDPSLTPALVRHLADKGFPGLLPDDFLSPRPLSAIAKIMGRFGNAQSFNSG
ncbi:condensation domain-containing protein [Streptomyces sp. NPDC101175]|uniref:condensation domain-containing protein n=1 Tax=Streptomyces sp. NPDC101175 TaxID=3366123 RepID=UPI0038372528